MGNCRLVKIKNSSGTEYSPESLKTLDKLLEEGSAKAFNMSKEGENVPLLMKGIKEMLYAIGDAYNNRDLDKLEPLVERHLTALGWKSFIPRAGLKNTMSKTYRKSFQIQDSGLHSYIGSGTLEEIQETNRMFLDRTFGSVAYIKNLVKLQASHIMINTFIIDRENGSLVLNISEVNKNAKEQKLKLFEQVIKYLKTNPELKNLPEKLFDDAGNYTFALSEDSFKKAINDLEVLLFSVDSASQIETLYAESHKSLSAKAKYDAAIAWFILKNFDNFVDTLVGEAFDINLEYRGKFVNEDVYSYATKGKHLITSWTTSDEVVLETRISKLAQTLINSTPFLFYGTETNSDKFIKFEDYYKIITKLKDLTLLPITSEIVLDFSNPLMSTLKNSLSIRDKELIEGKSLCWIINNIRTNPQRFLKVAMSVINNSEIKEILGTIFTKEEWDKCWSIYKGIFDSNYEKSINHILNKYDYRSKNYYSLLTQVADAIFSVNHLLYNDDDGIITIRSLRDQSSDNTRREIESTILRSNTRRRNYDFKKNELDPYEATPIENTNLGEEKILNGISFNLNIGEDVLNISVIDMGKTVSYKLNNKPIIKNEINKFKDSSELLSFIAKQVHIDFNKDVKFKENYYNKAGDNALPELLDLASIILLNKYVSNVILKDVVGPKETKQKLKSLYPDKIGPGYDGLYNEMKLIPDSKLNILERLAEAKDWTTGIALAVLVKDAEGNNTSTQTISRLLGALSSQFEQLSEYKRATSYTTLDLLKASKRYKGLKIEFVDSLGERNNTPIALSVNHDTKTIKIVESVLKEKYDLKSWTKPIKLLDNSSADALLEDEFETFDEFLNFCLEHEYQHILHPRTNELTTGEYETKINNYALQNLTFIFSPIKNFSILQPGFYKGFANIKELKSPLGNKQHTQFTVAEYIQGGFMQNFVKGFMSFTDYSGKNVFGNGAIGILPSVNSDKNTIGVAMFDLNQRIPGMVDVRWADLENESLSEIIRKELGLYYQCLYNAIAETYNILQLQNPLIPLDFDNNFEEFNKYCKDNNIKAYDKLYELTLKYNSSHPLNPIKIIDQIHYIKVDKSGTEITGNNTIKALLKRYSHKNQYDAFIKLKELDLLQALTDENVSFNLYDSFEIETPGTWLREKYPNWVGKNSHNNGKMTLAKITKDGKTFDITDKNDLIMAALELGINISKNLHNLKGFQVQLHPMLQKWNSYDYLLSQEFLLAGVGSHVAHPHKTTHKTPIIYNKPNVIIWQNNWTREIVANNQDKIFLFGDNTDDRINTHYVPSSTQAVIRGLDNAIGIDTKKNRGTSNESYFTDDDFDIFKRLVDEAIQKAINSGKTIVLPKNGIGTGKAQLNIRAPKLYSYLTRKLNSLLYQILLKNNPDLKDNVLIYDYPASQEEALTKWEHYKKLANRENKILLTLDSRIYNLVSSDFSNITMQEALDLLLDNEIKEEAARFLALHKRNVSFTAAMHPFLLNQINGIPNEYNMAVIDDITYELYTVMGNTTNHAPFDGATFVNPLVVYWENDSLEGDKAGIDKKQFIHYYDEFTGTGGIIKTAGFGITNDRAKNHEFYRTMSYNMMKRPWINSDGTRHVVYEGGILKDFLGNDIDYGPIYFKNGSKYYMREIVKYNNDNTYTVVDSEVDIYGDIISQGEPKRFEFEGDIIVNSNYDVWQLFGGWNSMEIGENGTLIPSENSLKLTALTANTYGEIISEDRKVEDASDIVLPMKMSDIHYMPTVGAIKQGAANINPKNLYYKKGTLNHMRVKMRLGGIQLDKEHHADGSTLSLMTQVISAAAAKGYTINKSDKIYQALYNITKLSTKEFRNELGEITTNPEKFDIAVAHIILLTILNSSASDGKMLQNIAKDLILEFLNNKNIELTKEFADKINSKIPYSARSIYKKLITALTSSLTKAGIKQNISGILAVLNPTLDIIKLYKVPVLDSNGNPIPGKYKTCKFGQLEEYFNIYGVTNERELLLKIQEELPIVYQVSSVNNAYSNAVEQIGNISDVEIGKYYIISRGDGTNEIVYVNMPNSTKDSKTGEFPTIITPHGLKVNKYGYKDLKDDFSIVSIKEYLLEGLDLKSYNVRFTGTINGEEQSFLLADLDIVQDFFDIKKTKGEEQYLLILLLLGKYKKLTTLHNVITKDLLSIWELKSALSESENLTNRAEIMLRLVKAFKNNPSEIYKYSKYSENSLERLFYEYIVNNAQRVLHRELQLNLNGLSKTDSKLKWVTIDGKKCYINKDSIQILSYGAIMPKTFKSNLGLDLFDDLETIKHDLDFFVRRLINKFTTKVDNYTDYDENGNEYTVYNFHLELKKANGRHIYVRAGTKGAKLENKVNIHTYTDESGKIYRRDSDGNILHPLFSINDEVYLDENGNEIIVTSPDTTTWKTLDDNKIAIISNDNGTFTTIDDHEVTHIEGNKYYDTVAGIEIEKIETSGIQFYLDNMEYNSIFINNAVTDSEFTTILERAINSTNSVANNIATKIKKLGSKEKNPEAAIKKQRELSDMLGDYEKLLLLDPQGPQKEFYKFAQNHITKLGRRMHTSFLKTLNIVAARIPAQNQQSFMAMEVEAYDNPDINSAYVSTYQFFLLGSDLDIDAVSLLTFTLNKSGLYVGHSPYYNLDSKELAEVSEEIPFPTGLKIEIVESVKDSTLTKYIDQIDLLNDLTAETELLEGLLDINIGKGLFNLFIRKNGEVSLNLNLDSEENIQTLIKLLKEPQIIASGTEFINDFYSIHGIALTEDQVKSLDNQLVNIINKHNLYLNKANISKRTNIERNWLTKLIFDLISDPINQLEALSSVDEVTANAKSLSKKSIKANVQDTFSPGNVANKYQSISENMVGKDGIAICATGLKSFFALTLLHNLIMNSEDTKAKDALMCEVKIGGKVYRGLANIFTDKLFTNEEEYEEISLLDEAELNRIFSQKVKNYLLELLIASDASNELSALLSLSTDNAKELVLAKINAGTSTIGMYLYGLSLGIPFDTLYKIMTSKLGFRLAELTKGNSFNGDSGTNDIIGALDYILKEPSEQILKFDSINYPNIPSPSSLLLKGKKLRDVIKDENGNIDILKISEYFESKREDVFNIANIIKNSQSETKDQDAIKYTILYNQLIDFAIQYALDMKLAENTFYETVYGGANILSDFETLAMGALEMKQIGKILRLNQEIKTDPQELLKQVSNIENALVKRISLLRRYNLRHFYKYHPGELLELDTTDFYAKAVEGKNFNYKEECKIDFERFITDPLYALDLIKYYDIIKAAYNPLKILYGVIHYKGYAETLYEAYKGWKQKSSKFALVVEEKQRVEIQYNIYDSKLQDQVVKNLENIADTFYRRKWMQNRYKKPIVLPASTDERQVLAFNDTVKAATPIKVNREIRLGTTLGDANFKLWMEEVVIPDLKEYYPNNKFILDLKFIVNPKTLAGTISTNMGLPINMLPRSEYERDLFNEYKKAFNDLIKEDRLAYSDAKGKKYPVQELLFLYSLITNNGKISATSLHSIFEDYMTNPVAISYHNAISEMDKKSELTIEEIKKNFDNDDIIPFSTRYRGGSDRFKEFDKETESIIVWEKYVPSYDEDSQYDDDDGGYTPKYSLANTNLLETFNTDYFLFGVKAGDVITLQPNAEKFPELNKYNILVEKLINGTFKLVSISAKSEENSEKAELFYKTLINGKLLSKIKITDSTTKDIVLDYEQINNEIEQIECLNV